MLSIPNPICICFTGDLTARAGDDLPSFVQAFGVIDVCDADGALFLPPANERATELLGKKSIGVERINQAQDDGSEDG